MEFETIEIRLYDNWVVDSFAPTILRQKKTLKDLGCREIQTIEYHLGYNDVAIIQTIAPNDIVERAYKYAPELYNSSSLCQTQPRRDVLAQLPEEHS
jgi:hypothetical protein